MYRAHPDRELRDKFERRPYQGADPSSAAYVFVGLDANYAEDIEAHPIYSDVLEYHADGVAFWQGHGVHHPFLLPSYSGDGRRYHLNFARIGFAPTQAEQVSFVELLHVRVEPSHRKVRRKGNRANGAVSCRCVWRVRCLCR